MSVSIIRWVSRRACVSVGLAALTVCMAAAPGHAGPSFRLVMPVEPGMAIDSSSAALNNDGLIAFRALDAAGNAGLFATPRSGGIRLTIQGSNLAAADLGRPTRPALTGEVGFHADYGDGEGIYARAAGGVLITVIGQDFSALGEAQGIVHRDIAARGVSSIGEEGIFARSIDGGSIITIVGRRTEPQLSGFGSPSLSSSGDVAFTAFELVGEDQLPGVFMRSSGGTLLTVRGTGFAQNTRLGQPVVTDFGAGGSSRVIFATEDDIEPGSDQRNPLYSDNGAGGVNVLYEAPGTSASTPTGNAMGSLIFAVHDGRHDTLKSSINNLRALRGGGHSVDTLIALGDPLMGSTVTFLDYSPYGLNDNNEFAFYAELASGAAGIFMMQVPAPGAGAALLLLGASCAARRRR